MKLTKGDLFSITRERSSLTWVSKGKEGYPWSVRQGIFGSPHLANQADSFIPSYRNESTTVLQSKSASPVLSSQGLKHKQIHFLQPKWSPSIVMRTDACLPTSTRFIAPTACISTRFNRLLFKCLPSVFHNSIAYQLSSTARWKSFFGFNRR